MTPFAHIASGYWVYKVASSTPITEPSFLLSLSIAGALAPDIDGLFGKQMRDHRNTIFHAPLFWFLTFISMHIFTFLTHAENMTLYINVFFFAVTMHLFLDWFSGRTTGIRIFYPFSKKVYALFPICPKKGNIPVLPNKEHVTFWKFYLENKFLVFVELLIVLSPLVFLL